MSASAPPNPLTANSAIVLISYDFFPSSEIGGRRTTALARFLADKGVRVAVVSAFGGHDVQPGSQIAPGLTAVPVRRPRRLLIDAVISQRRNIPSPASDHTPGASRTGRSHGDTVPSLITRSLRETFFRTAYFVDEFKRWSWLASRAALAAARDSRASLIVSSGPPSSALLAGTLAASRLGIPHIADFRDPWTDAIAMSPRRRLECLLQRPLERWVVESAACVTSTGAMVADALSRRYPRAGPKVHVVRNGYDGDAEPASSDTGGRLSILFAGELYLGRNPFPFLDAVEQLIARRDVDPDRIRVTFMGRVDSYEGQSLSNWLAGRRCAGIVAILPHLPPQAVADAVAQATVLLNLAQQQPLSVPAKTYEHLICGREMLLLCENDSETARVLKEVRGVNQVDPRDAGALAKVLADLYRRHVIEGRLAAPSVDEVRQYSRKAANERFWTLFQAATRFSAETSD